MPRLIERERVPFGDRPLGRHINHDSKSRRFPYRGPRKALRSIRHESHMPILDQGNVGACTGFAAIACMGRGGYFPTVDPADRYQLDHASSMALYSRATQLDQWRGEYPPDDTGSDGLSVAKGLTEVGEIKGYEHALTLGQALDALMIRPWITGTYWLDGMFDPDPYGVIHPVGPVAGGHEYCGDEYVATGDLFGTRQRQATEPMLGFPNSWSTSFADGGRFYMTVREWDTLRARDGDVTIFVPSDVAAPTPEPDPDQPDTAEADRAFAAVLGPWCDRPRTFYKPVHTAGRTWLEARGFRDYP
jgi:hypothetical protein